jgi:Tol biopolymer transport system component
MLTTRWFYLLITAFFVIAACVPQPPLETIPATSLPSSPSPSSVPTLVITEQAIDSPTALPSPFAGEKAWIAYQTNRGGSEGVWLIHPDGTEDYKLRTGWSGPTLMPAWSPDGTKLVFETRGGDTEPLYEYDLATESSRQLFTCENPCLGDGEPAYSPDGSKVVFGRAQLPFVHSDLLGEEVPSDCGLWIGDVATGAVEQLTGKGQMCDRREASPRWSPDGSKIAYFRERYDDSGVTNAIFVMDANGGEEQQLTDWELVAGYPDWSPDGEWIVFAIYPLWTFNFDPVVSNLYRMHPDGSEIEQLTFYETPDIRANQPRYTPDGNWIIFTAVTSSSRSLWAMPAEGGEPVVIAQGGIYTHGTWQP